MAKEIDPFGYFDLTPQEQSSETSAITAMMAGIASGIIKVPEGVISLGAELIDLGFDTDTATEVKKHLMQLTSLKKLQMTELLVR